MAELSRLQGAESAIVLGLTALPAPTQATTADVVAAVKRLQSQGAAVKVYQRTDAGPALCGS